MTEVRFRNAAESGGRPLSLDRETWLRIVFLLGVPMFLGTLLGWLRVGATGAMPRGEAIVFILTANVPVWLCYAAATAGLARLTLRWASPLAVKLAIGGLIGSLLAYPLLAVRRILLDLPPLPSFAEPLVALDSLLRYNSSGIFTWVVVGLGFHYLAGLPMFGHAVAAAPSADPAAPAGVTGLQGRLPAHVRGPVRLLVASEHYLRVVTERGEAMVLYRFGDAVAEQSRDRGAQVHRSFWIARDAVASVRRNGAKVTLGLEDGTDVPVSRTYLMDAKRAGIV